MEKTGKSKAWTFINSPFFLTVIISFMTFCYAKWQEGRSISRTGREKVAKLDLEISSRLAFFDDIRKSEYLSFDSALLILENPSSINFPSGAFPEFKDRSFRSLIAELHSLVPEDQKAELDTVLKNSNLTSIAFIYTAKQKKEKNLLLAPLGLFSIGTLNEKFYLKRWNSSLIKQ